MYFWRAAGMAAIAILAITSVVDAQPIMISAVDLRSAYQDDKREANLTYKGKLLVVFGYFGEVSLGIVDFKSGASCSMETRVAKNAMKTVDHGTYIVMVGEGRGHTFREPFIGSCRRLLEDDPLYVPEAGASTPLPTAPTPTESVVAEKPVPEQSSLPVSEAPTVVVEPDPVPEPTSVEPVEVPAEWLPASYVFDGQDAVGTAHIVYIYPESSGSVQQMIAAAMLVAVETFREHGGDEVMVAVMEGPGENYPVETVTLWPGGCPANKQCMGDLWTSDINIPEAVIASVVLPSEAETAEAERKRSAAAKAQAAAERARAAAKAAQAKKDDSLYEQCFNPWNGSHKLLVELVKENINTPRSFKHVKTTAYLGDFPRPVVMQFDAQNAFGAMIRTTVQAESALDCSVMITEVVGP